MARIKLVICPALRAIALMIVVGLVLGPETIRMKVEEAMSAAWRALGDQLANRELDAIAQQLDRERRDAQRIEVARDGLSTRLRSLEAFRECVATQVGERCPPLGANSEPELDRLDTGIAMLSWASARAARVLDEARESIRRREGELISLQAAADARRMNQVLVRSVGDPSLWSDRVACTREFLRSDRSRKVSPNGLNSTESVCEQHHADRLPVRQ
jgi:hypothetical protein